MLNALCSARVNSSVRRTSPYAFEDRYVASNRMTVQNRLRVISALLLAVMAATASASPNVNQPPSAVAASSQEPSLPSPPTPNPIEIALKAQLDEMRRSEDRLLSTVHWSLGTVATLAVGLALFGWWSASRVYQRDIAALRDELKRTVDEVAQQLRTDAERSLSKTAADLERLDNERYAQERSRLLSESISYVLTHVADLRLAAGDLEGSASAAIDLYHTAKQGNTNYMAHAFDKLIAVLQTRSASAETVSTATIRRIRSILRESPAGAEDERVQSLQKLVERLE